MTELAYRTIGSGKRRALLFIWEETDGKIISSSPIPDVCLFLHFFTPRKDTWVSKLVSKTNSYLSKQNKTHLILFPTINLDSLLPRKVREGKGKF